MKRYCLHQGCDVLVDRGYCDRHERAGRKIRQRFYVGAAVNYGRRWRRLRNEHLAAFPACAVCFAKGIVEPATEVDHLVPHRGDPALFWDRANLQSLCETCHAQKTAAETFA